MLKLDDKNRYDSDSLAPGEGFVRFWDGHEEPIENWYKVSNEIIFYTPSGHYMYDIVSKCFYRIVWHIDEISLLDGPLYRARRIAMNDKIREIVYKEKENG